MATLMADPSVFGLQLRHHRNRLGLTLDGLAERVGVTLLSLHRYETGVRFPQWDVVVRLADALGVTPDAFLTATGPTPDAASQATTVADRPRGKRK